MRQLLLFPTWMLLHDSDEFGFKSRGWLARLVLDRRREWDARWDAYYRC